MLFIIVQRRFYLEASKCVSSRKFYITMFVCLAALLAFDRFTKYLAVVYLKDTAGITLIDGVLRLTYLENRGAAFGMLQGMQPVFWILTAAFLILAAWFFRKVPKTRRYLPLNICVLFLVSGAIGNFIDRIINKYVVDFIYFEIIDFPIFNVADIYVSLSVVSLVLLILFYYKEGEFSFLSSKKKRKDDE